ncbi:MAG: toll/interleukin-1 receptor domain-containing protein [Caulobacterales bacterium]
MNDIFLSYKQTDRARVQPFAEALEAEGFSVWWDAEIPLGQTYYSAIETQLAAAKVVIPVWTVDSVSSEWVREEATKGKHQNKLLPVKLDAVEPPVGFSTIQTADLSRWNGDRSAPEWRTIVSHVRQLAGGPTPPPRDMPAPGAARPSPAIFNNKGGNAFGGTSDDTKKKKGPWKPILIAAGLAVIGLAVLGAISNHPPSGPAPFSPSGPGYNNGPVQPAVNSGEIQAAEAAAYNAAIQVRNRSAYEAFLKLYPQSSYAQEISNRLSSCRMEQQASTSSMPVTATGWAAYAMGGCNTAQATANSYLQQGCLNYSPAGQLSNPQYVPSQTMDAMGNPVCVVQAQATCAFPQASSASYEVCQ